MKTFEGGSHANRGFGLEAFVLGEAGEFACRELRAAQRRSLAGDRAHVADRRKTVRIEIEFLPQRVGVLRCSLRGAGSGVHGKPAIFASERLKIELSTAAGICTGAAAQKCTTGFGVSLSA